MQSIQLYQEKPATSVAVIFQQCIALLLKKKSEAEASLFLL